MTNMQQARSFRIGYYFDLYSLRIDDWARELDFNRALRPEVLELLIEPPGSVRALRGRRTRWLANALSGMPLRLHAPTLSLSFCASIRSIRSATLREHLDTLDLACALGATEVTLHGGDYSYILEANHTSAGEVFLEAVAPLVREAEARGVVLCLENLKGARSFPTVQVQFESVLNAFPQMRLAFDIRHAAIEGVDIEECIERNLSRISSFHYRDDAPISGASRYAWIRSMLAHQWNGDLIIEDPALNRTDKSDKRVLESGVRTVLQALSEVTSAPY